MRTACPTLLNVPSQLWSLVCRDDNRGGDDHLTRGNPGATTAIRTVSTRVVFCKYPRITSVNTHIHPSESSADSHRCRKVTLSRRSASRQRGSVGRAVYRGAIAQ